MTEQPRPSSASPRASFMKSNPDKDAGKEKEVDSGLRHRGITRAATFSADESLNPSSFRRNSGLSDSVSEARNSIRSSTDDLFLPRASKGHDADLQDESHWQSAPLGLALLPAIAGVFFQNGGAVVTDITLLILAAIFLNWSVRLPWDWYRSAQAVRQQEQDGEYATLEPEDGEDTAGDSEEKRDSRRVAAIRNSATKELQIHELAALASCFIFPMIGTWLLHTIRYKLSRPSEGLVSNYNLTIFLLASEIRPFAHLLRMVQARTLHLQRTVRSLSHEEDESKLNDSKIQDLTKRLEELEAHVAEAATARLSNDSQPQPQPQPQPQQQQAKPTTTPEQDIRKTIQPDIEALNRAVRRYEKRTAVNAFETDSRLRNLEAQVRDAVALGAAAQRSSSGSGSGSGSGVHPRRIRSGILMLVESAYTIMLIPVQIFLALAMLPFRAVTRCLELCRRWFVPSSSVSASSLQSTMSAKKGKMPQQRGKERVSSSPRRPYKKSSPQTGLADSSGTGSSSSLKTIREY